MSDQSLEHTDIQPARAETQDTLGNAILFNLRQLARFRADHPYVQVLSDLGTARVILLTFKAGQQLKDYHTSSQLLVQTLRGRTTFVTTSNRTNLQAGMVLQVEENVSHTIVAQTDAVMLLTILAGPTERHIDTSTMPGSDLVPLVKRE